MISGLVSSNPARGAIPHGGLGRSRPLLVGVRRRRQRIQGSAISTTRAGLLVLGIETSCDDTCVSLLSSSSPSVAALLYSAKRVSDNKRYRGVMPTVAIESHTSELPGLVEGALRRLPTRGPTCYPAGPADCGGRDDGDGPERVKPDVIAVTRGPGMMSNLATGLNLAKGLALAMDRPLVAVNHMQAHALTPRLVAAMEARSPGSSVGEAVAVAASTSSVSGAEGPGSEPVEFPYLSLLVSGGHTQLCLSLSPERHPVLAAASHLAIGRMLDHAARIILPPETLAAHNDVMYARLLESFAFPDAGDSDGDEAYGGYRPPPRRAAEMETSDVGRRWGWTLPVPLAMTRRMEFDFSGLLGAVAKAAAARGNSGNSPDERQAMAREVMRLGFEHLVSRVLFVLGGDVDDALAALTVGGSRGTNSNEPPPPPRGRDVKRLVVSGGVASNGFLMHVLRRTVDVRGYGHIRVVAPPAWLCTDNAAMVAWAGAEMSRLGRWSSLRVLPLKRWPPDAVADVAADDRVPSVPDCRAQTGPSL